MNEKLSKFPKDVSDKLSHYVYRLIDPRNGFVGQQANKEILDLYLNKRLPSNMQRVRGMASPILYNYEK